jgi:hypothetical protein
VQLSGLNQFFDLTFLFSPWAKTISSRSRPDSKSSAR